MDMDNNKNVQIYSNGHGNSIFFWKPDEPYGVFSQWHRLPFVVEGIQYETAEQYMMAKKALLAQDLDTYLRIMAESDPAKCAKLGKEVRNLDLAVWDVWKREVVFNGNYAKFSQNSEAKELLLRTVPRILVEANPYDFIWGIGMHADDPYAAEPAFWRGQNLLGSILMMVRNVLENEMLLSGEKMREA